MYLNNIYLSYFVLQIDHDPLLTIRLNKPISLPIIIHQIANYLYVFE